MLWKVRYTEVSQMWHCRSWNWFVLLMWYRM